MNLPSISNSQIISHYQWLGILNQWEWATELVAKIWNQVIHVLIDGNLRAQKWKQPALSLNHQWELIINPREAYNRANRTVTRLFDIPMKSTNIKSISKQWFRGEDGSSFELPEYTKFKIGDELYFYAGWFWYSPRWLVINGHEIFYRTISEHTAEAHRNWKKDNKRSKWQLFFEYPDQSSEYDK